MTVATTTRRIERFDRAPRPSSLADVLDVILDKGIVIDAYVRVSLVGIELLTIDARIVIASVDTYLRFAEAVNRLDLQAQGPLEGLPGIQEQMSGEGPTEKARGVVGGAASAVKDAAQGAVQTVRGDGDKDKKEK
jgi:gas vesicle structural protein